MSAKTRKLQRAGGVWVPATSLSNNYKRADAVLGDAQKLKGDAKNAIKDGVNKVADTANKKL